jgi:hypothetical protein
LDEWKFGGGTMGRLDVRERDLGGATGLAHTTGPRVEVGIWAAYMGKTDLR